MKTNVKEFKDKIVNGHMTRREFAKTLAAVGLTTTVVPMFSRKASASGNVSYFTWGGYDDAAFFQNYKAKHGVMPDFSFFGSENEALAKIRAGFKTSIGHPCSDTFPRWARAGIVQGLDKSRLEHWDSLWPNVKNFPGQYDDNGNVNFAPFDWGNSSVAYRTDLVDPKYIEENSWEILFDPEYAGRLATYNTAGSLSAVAGLVLGIDPAEIWSPNDEQIARIRAKLQEQQPLIRFYWDDQTTMEQGLASGELVAAYAWNEAPVRLQRQGLPIEYMNPKEGILFWVCGLTRISSEFSNGDEQAIYDMVNEMQSPEVGKYVLEEWGYGHSNKKSFELADKKILEEVNLSNPEEMMNGGVFIEEIPDDINQKLENMIQEVKAGL